MRAWEFTRWGGASLYLLVDFSAASLALLAWRDPRFGAELLLQAEKKLLGKVESGADFPARRYSFDVLW